MVDEEALSAYVLHYSHRTADLSNPLRAPQTTLGADIAKPESRLYHTWASFGGSVPASRLNLREAGRRVRPRPGENAANLDRASARGTGPFGPAMRVVCQVYGF